MNKHLILTIHGIGEQKPGETVDLVVGAATTPFVDQKRAEEDPLRRRDVGSVEVCRDFIELTERPFDGSSRNAELFPVHLRRVRSCEKTEVDGEALFAEVYWADKSPAPVGFLGTAIELLKVILGLGYIAMDNVESVRGRVIGAVVHGFTWLMFGAIAPMHALLFIGVLFLLFDLVPVELGPQHLSPMLFAYGLVALLIGMRFCRDHKCFSKLPIFRNASNVSYLVRLFGTGLAILGALVVLSAIARLTVGWDCVCTVLMPDTSNEFSSNKISPAWQFGCLARGMLLMLGSFWFLAVISVLAMFLLSWGAQLKNIFSNRKPAGVHLSELLDNSDLYPSVCGIMVLLWLTISSSFWLALGEIISSIGHDPSIEDALRSPTSIAIEQASSEPLPSLLLNSKLDEGIGSLAVTAGATLLVLSFALLLTGVRKLNAEGLHDRHPWVSRMLLNLPLRVISLFAIYLVAYSLYEIVGAKTEFISVNLETETGVSLHNFLIFSLGGKVADLFFSVDLSWLTEIATERANAIKAALAMLAIALYYFSDKVAGALGIFRDIVVYSQAKRCALFEENDAERRKNFVQRNEINSRFVSAFHYCLSLLKPCRVTIITHSLGTVIATQMLSTARVKELATEYGNPEITLVTMGSPVTHIYQKYFPRDFTLDANDLPSQLKWYNIFRSDDFVGTTVDGLAVDNFSVSPRGHTGYFSDHDVWRRLYDDVGFRLF